MKYVILTAVVILCGFIGYLFSRKYKQRSNFFSALILLCQKFDVEINYSRERLKNIFLSLDEKIKKNLSGIDKNYLLYLDKEIELEKSELFKNIGFLKESEKDVIFPFFRTLGRSDVDSQSKEIKNYLTRFESLFSSADAENKKYGTLSIKLGVILGLFLVVIFVWGCIWMLRLFLR